jgi:hypothetical protein
MALSVKDAGVQARSKGTPSAARRSISGVVEGLWP